MIKEFTSRFFNKAIRLNREIKFQLGLGKKKTNGNKIIMYHGVTKCGNKDFNLRHISSKDFEKQIIYFKKHYNILSLDNYWSGKFDNNKINISITFDDGYANNFKYALPVLEKYKVPATFFITGLNPEGYDILWPDLIEISASLTNENIVINDELFVKKGSAWIRNSDQKTLHQVIKEMGNFEYKLSVFEVIKEIIPDFKKNPKYHDYWKLMSDEEIKIASLSNYITIGSHGYFHNNLGNIPLVEAVVELQKSKIYLESITQKTIDSIAYPDGSYTRRLAEEATKIGFYHQLAVNDNLFPEDISGEKIKTRYGIYPVDSIGNIIFEFEQCLE